MKCKVCDSNTISFYKGRAPIEGYVCENIEESLSQPSFEMELIFCENCNLLYHKEIGKAKKYLDKLYLNHLSTFHINKDFEAYLNVFVENIFKTIAPYKIHNILEIGCNDGYILSLFKRYNPDINLFGVEPSTQFLNKWKERGIKVYNNYLNQEAINFFRNITFDVIYFRHVFEHIFDPLHFIELVSALSNENTIIVIESPYLKSLINDNRIDNFGYSHSNFFTLNSVNKIINKYGFQIVDYEIVETDGGSFVIYIKKEHKSNVQNFNDFVNISEVTIFIRNFDIIKAKYQKLKKIYTNEEIAGYGAGAKGQLLVHLFGLNNIIHTVFDDTPEYNNKYIPGTEIKIINPQITNYSNLKAIINLVPTHSKVIKNKIPFEIKFIDYINE